MGKPIDLTGQRFGRLTVIGLAPRGMWKRGETSWIVRCDCGTVRAATQGALKSNHIRSCGCLQLEQRQANGRKIFLSMTPEQRQKFARLGAAAQSLEQRRENGRKVLASLTLEQRAKQTSPEYLERLRDLGIKGAATVTLDLTGQRFGLLTVVGLAPRAMWRVNKKGRLVRSWMIRCDCGKSVEQAIPTGCLRYGKYSCGCKKRFEAKRTESFLSLLALQQKLQEKEP